ncbi:MAG: ECF transporter S component [Clostridia bacterium]|nr:ECF transporter S component [Clostridia bacterium]
MSKTKKLILSALFLSIGVVLPLATGQIKEIGDSLLPMHLPVMLCGLVCGYGYGGAVGFILPFLRALTFGMPPAYPNAVWMAMELCTYGFVIGFLYGKAVKKNMPCLLLSLSVSMIAGRIVWGVSKAVLLGIGGSSLTVHAFVMGGFIDAFPGIVLQFILIPTVMSIAQRLRKDGLII